MCHALPRIACITYNGRNGTLRCLEIDLVYAVVI
jgi:hypothetical protein